MCSIKYKFGVCSCSRVELLVSHHLNLLQSLANNELILSILVIMTASFLLIISDIAIFDTLA